MPATYTATFTTEHYLTMTAEPLGRKCISIKRLAYSRVTCADPGHPKQQVLIYGWTGTGSGSYTGPNNPARYYNEWPNK